MLQKLASLSTRWSMSWVPDSWVIAVILSAVSYVLALICTKSTAFQLVQYWGNGLWVLLSFGMQMCLIIMTGYIVATTPIMSRALNALAGMPKTPKGCIALMAIISMGLAWINWGLSIIGSAVFVRFMAKKQLIAGENDFYQLYFQEPGKAERELEANVRDAMCMLLYSASGDPPPEKRWRFLFGKSEKLMDTCIMPEALPAWLTEHDVDYYTQEFQRTGFRGGLNWYRNIDRTWELSPFLNGAKLRQPALFVAGAEDAVITMYRQAFDELEENVPNLKEKVLLPGAGHWIQQERASEVNRLIIDFLRAEEVNAHQDRKGT